MKLRKRIAHIESNRQNLKMAMKRKIRELHEKNIPIIKHSELTPMIAYGEVEHYYFTEDQVDRGLTKGFIFNEVIPFRYEGEIRIEPYKEYDDQE